MIRVLVIAFLASVGGLAVFWGLALEKCSEKEQDSDVADLRSSKAKAKLGEKLVRWGVFAETVLAFILAISEGLNAIKTANVIAKSDPRNANISDMSATAILIVMGTGFNDPTNKDIHGRVATMTLWNNDKEAAPVDSLNSDSFTRNDFSVLWGNPNSSNSREYGVRFHSFNFRAFNGLETPVKAIDDVRFARMDIYFLPHGSVIAAGGVDLVVNNTHRLFQIDTNRSDFKNPGPPYS